MGQSFSIGGADIYVSSDTKSFRVLPKNGNKNVIEYNGMRIEYPDQIGVKSLTSNLSSCIFMENGRTSIRLEGPTIFGSPDDDKVNSYSVGSHFYFKNGGKDDIRQYITNDSNYDDDLRACKYSINEDDVVTERYIDKVMDLKGNLGDKIVTITNKNDNSENDISEPEIVWHEMIEDEDDNIQYGGYNPDTYDDYEDYDE